MNRPGRMCAIRIVALAVRFHSLPAVGVVAAEIHRNPPPASSASTVSNVSLSDDNTGLAVVADTLTGSCTYADAENDAEGTSRFHWLRDGAEIADVTTASYILDAADFSAQITFEVTPVAASGSATGSADSSDGIAVADLPRFAFVANRTDDTVDAGTGVLQRNGYVSNGEAPVSVTIDPSGQTAYVANRFSDDLSVYAIDAASGALSTLRGSPFMAGKVDCQV